MKKKIIYSSLLSLAAVLALASCGEAPAITNEEAQTKATAIKAKQAEEDFEKPTTFQLVGKMEEKLEINAKSADETEIVNTKQSVSVNSVYEYDLSHLYFHSNSKITQKSTDSTSNEDQEYNMWLYVLENTMYMASSDSSESTYQTFSLEGLTSEAIAAQFVSILDSAFHLSSLVLGEEILDIDSILKEYELNDENKWEYDGGELYTLNIGLSVSKNTFTSKGDGNLGFVFNANGKSSEEGMSVEAKVSYSMEVNNYLLSSMDAEESIKLKVNSAEETGTVNCSAKSSTYLKLASFTVNYPDLTNFTAK